jgi:predicted nucleic acid-binding protein
VIKIDACSLIYISRIDIWNLIKKLFDELIITPKVYEEVVVQGKRRGKPDAYYIEKLINENLIQIHETNDPLPDMKLGDGENQTIQEGIKEKVPVLIDEIKGQTIAHHLGLTALNLPVIFVDALLKEYCTEEEFDILLDKWILTVSPPIEKVIFLKNMKEIIKNDKLNR